MGTGYTRNDTSNNIADGNIINASDLDGEFDAIESAMSTSGHTHDGTSAEGGPVTVVGPAQDLVVTASEVKPKTDNTLDLGTSSLQFKDAYFQGTVDTDGIMTAATFEPDGDTAAGDNAAIGYTAAEGLILTGQGSTSDITFKNDADTTVFSIPTGTDDVLFPDNAKAMFGAGSDLSVYHDGTRSHIEEAGLGGLWISTNGTEIKLKQGGGVDEEMLVATPNGSVDLYYNNNLKLATTSTGIDVTGNATFADNGKAIFGAGSDLQIYHDGSHSYLYETGTGEFRIKTNGNIIQFLDNSNNYLIKATVGAEVGLYFNTAQKLATTNTGIDVTGTVTADGLTVDGTGTFNNNVGVVVSGATPSIRITETDTTDENTQLIHASGSFRIRTASDDYSTVTERLRIDHTTGDISFYEDTGSTAKLTWDASAESLKFVDDGQAIFGDSSDLTIEHNGTNSTITNATGHLYIMNSSDDKDIHIQSDDGSGGLATYFLADGSAGQAKLFHNNAGTSTLRLNTSSDGIDITGHADIEGHFTATDGCTITTADNSTQLTLTSTDADASEGPRLDLKRDSSSPADGDLIGTIRFLGEDSTSASNTFGEIQVEADDITDGSEDGEMRLMIRNNGNLRNAVEIGSTEVVFNEASDDVDFRVESDNNTHALFLQGSNGNVGIGTSSPARELVVSGSSQASIALQTTASGSTLTDGFQVQADGSHAYLWNYENTNILLGTNNTERMRINSSGNVGIGTTNPIADLSLVDSSTGSGMEFQPEVTTDTNRLTNYDRGDSSYKKFRLDASEQQFYISGSEKMRINSSGNVGIGVTNVIGKIHADDSGGATLTLTRTSGATSGNLGKLRFGNTNVDSALASIVAIQDGATDNSAITFGTQSSGAGEAEAMRIDSSGNLLVGKTSESGNTAGHFFSSTGYQRSTRNGSTQVLNRITTDGNITDFQKDGTTVGSIGVLSSNNMYFGSSASGHAGLVMDGSSIVPLSALSRADNAIDLGEPSYRFDDIYATNGTIQTSDINEKQDIEELTEAEQRVAVAAKGLLRKFRWKSAVAEKGEAARTHFGIIAQDLQAAFEAEGLDAGDYAMFISSTWTDEETGEERTRMGVRYSELLAFIIAAI